MQTRRDHSIVITGCGWVTPFDSGSIDTILQTAATRPPNPNKSQGYSPVADDILAAHGDLSQECRNDPGAWLTAVCFECARSDARLVSGSVRSERIGLVLGNALAGQSGMIDFANDVRQQSPRFVSPIRFPQTVGNYISGALSRAYDIRGPNSTIAHGPASGLDAIVEGCALLSAGKADVVFAGGTERLTPTLAAGLAEPGITYSDGACLFSLERHEDAMRRGASIQAMILTASEPRASAPATPTSSAAIHSVAGTREPDAVVIEHWIGRCLGALGAAAVAAAIGALRGLAIPVVEGKDMSAISARRIQLDDSTAPTARVTACADDGHRTSIALSLPLRPAKQ